MATAKRIRNVTFNMRIVERKNRLAERKALDAVSKEIEKDLKRTIGIQGPPRSQPGQPPRKDTGTLHADLRVFRRGRSMVVKTYQYGIWLDGGTSRMAARPWIRRRIHNRRKHWDKRMAVNYRRFNK